ncbi:hypothetical protein [Lysinibacillus sp. LZ02]|uniref:hypothetical protein n=1 Tax=Lysinibacillus sp. LZ02 TaxID=3420668 RepID=UPI003D362862
MVNVICSGFVALLIAWFFAEGALGEANALTPEFFFILPIWAIGVLLMWRFVFKDGPENISPFKMIVSNFLLWLTIPLGLMFAFQFI